MSLTLADLEFLTTPTGETLLEELATTDLSDKHSLALVTRLRKSYSQEQVSTALTMARLRQRATGKFGERARHMFFTEDGLQQASHPLVRRYRAQKAAGRWVLDACCGIGTDSLAFAESGADVLGLDIDALRIAIAERNAAALGIDAQFQVQDVRAALPTGCEWIFFDPARRDERGKRIYDVERYLPPLSLVRQWQADYIIAKLSPGVDLAQVASYGGGVEFISVGGDLKEAVLHMGDEFTGTRAVLLTADGGVHHWQRQGTEPDVAIAAPQGWLCEPDASILRAGLVRDLAASWDGRMLDETIAYFCAGSPPESVWLRCWKVLDWMPFHLKKLRAYLRERRVGSVTVKKRGFAMTPEEMIPRLKLKGDESRLLVFTRHAGQPVVLICAE